MSFLENQLYAIGTRLLKKAKLDESISFLLQSDSENRCPYRFSYFSRTIYVTPEDCFFAFKAFHHLFFDAFNRENYFEFNKIAIAHEIGHALQLDLLEKERILASLKSFETLTSILTLAELDVQVQLYAQQLIETEDEFFKKFQLLSSGVTCDTFLGKWRGCRNAN